MLCSLKQQFIVENTTESFAAFFRIISVLPCLLPCLKNCGNIIQKPTKNARKTAVFTCEIAIFTPLQLFRVQVLHCKVD